MILLFLSIILVGINGKSLEFKDPSLYYGEDSITVEAAALPREGRQFIQIEPSPAGPFFFKLPYPMEETRESISTFKAPENPCWNEEAKFGKCMDLSECYPYVKTFNKKVLEETIMEDSGNCAYFDKRTKSAKRGVCCTNVNATRPFYSPVRIVPSEIPQFQEKATVLQAQSDRTNGHSYSEMENKRQSQTNVCGYRGGGGKIVGGTEAQPGEWPWMAALLNGKRQFCGGSLIDNVHILTAAHCVAHMNSYDVARLKVRLNEYNIKSENDGLNTIELRVRRVTRHKRFNGQTLYNDIALLTLERPISFSPEVSPVCLPSPEDRSNTYAGDIATVTGWGALKEGGRQPDVLMKVNVTVQTNRECEKNYGSDAPGGIIDSMLCASGPGRDSCSGDSGGPLSVAEGPQWVQVGIVSWGIGCGQNPYAGVYTRVTSFMPWILKNLVK